MGPVSSPLRLPLVCHNQGFILMTSILHRLLGYINTYKSTNRLVLKPLSVQASDSPGLLIYYVLLL